MVILLSDHVKYQIQGQVVYVKFLVTNVSSEKKHHRHTFHCYGGNPTVLLGRRIRPDITYYPPQKKKLDFIVFILSCDAENFITVSDSSYDISTVSKFMNQLVLELHTFSINLFIVNCFYVI